MDVYKKYVGKKVFIITKTNRNYSGRVTDYQDPILSLVTFKGLVDLDISNIAEIKEEQ